jgi:hypothetical protein
LGKRQPAAEADTSYAVHSVNTGALVCGPYEGVSGEKTARQECERLDREALQCRTGPSEAHPHGQTLSWTPAAVVLHDGEPQAYEVRTTEGVVI